MNNLILILIGHALLVANASTTSDAVIVDDLTCLKRAVESTCNGDQFKYSLMYPQLHSLSLTITPSELRSGKRALKEYSHAVFSASPADISGEFIWQLRQVMTITADPNLDGPQVVALLLRIVKELTSDASQLQFWEEFLGIMSALPVFKTIILAVDKDDYTELLVRLKAPPKEQVETRVKTLRRTKPPTYRTFSTQQYHAYAHKLFHNKAFLMVVSIMIIAWLDNLFQHDRTLLHLVVYCYLQHIY